MIRQLILDFFFYLSHPILLLPLVLMLILFVLLLINTEKLHPHVRIKNFYITWMLAVLYGFIYILGLIVLRFTQLATDRDFRELYHKYKNLFYEHFIATGVYYKLINFLLVLIILLLWLLLIVRAQRFLRHKVWQLYIYYVYKRYIRTQLLQFNNKTLLELSTQCIPDPSCQGILENWVQKYCRYYSLSSLLAKPQNWLFSIFSDRVGTQYIVPVLEKKYKILRIILLVITPICIAFECWQFNWCVHYVYYYLFFFVFAINYLLVDETICDINYAPEFVQILLEKNYGYPYVIYVNLTKAEENLLDLFAACPTKVKKIIPDLDKLLIEIEGFAVPGVATTNVIRFTRCFWREEKSEGILYNNLFTGRSFWEKDLHKLGDRYFVPDPNEPEAMEYYNQLLEEQTTA